MHDLPNKILDGPGTREEAANAEEKHALVAHVQGWREALWCLLRRWPSSQGQALLPQDPALPSLEAIPYQCMALHCSWIKSGGPVTASLSHLHLTVEEDRTCQLAALVLAAPSGGWHYHQRHRTTSPPKVIPSLCTCPGVCYAVHWGPPGLWPSIAVFSRHPLVFGHELPRQTHSNWRIE